MYLSLLALFIAIALVIWFAFLSEASVIAKVVIGLLFVVSWLLHPSAFPMAGFFLRIGIGIFVLFYPAYRKAKIQ